MQQIVKVLTASGLPTGTKKIVWENVVFGGVCILIKLHITAQPGPVTLIFQSCKYGTTLWGISVCMRARNLMCMAMGSAFIPGGVFQEG